MPEENFEEGARRKAEEFGMEPNADVWLRVQAAIQPERRRRALLLWWLLPLCIAGIMGGLLLKRSGEAPGRAGVVATGTHQKGKTHLPVEEKATTKTKKSAGHINNTIDGQELRKKNDGIINNQEEKSRTRETSGEEWKNQYAANKKKSIVQQEDNSGADMNRQPADTLMNVIENKVEPALLPKETIDVLREDSKSNQVTLNADSTGDYNKEVPSVAFAGKDSVSVKPDVGKTTEKKKKTERKKWQMGIVTEIGLTSWGKDLLTKEAESTSKYNTVPAASSMTIDSLLAVTSESQRTKNGVDAGIGFTVRKETGHHFYISGQLGYRYQQYQVYNVRTSSGAFQSLNADYLVNKNIYHSHFISLYAGTGRLLFSGNRNGLSVEAGLDNSLLLLNGRQNTRQTALDGRGGSSFAKADFYRWQPQLFLSLPFNWHTAGEVKFTVSPLARIGLHSYQKNGAGYGSNHLMSAGIQAVYFFR